ncbi:MAG: hypothetical protein ACI4KM_03440 [Oscillospiraceae bacterium]
MKNFSCVSINYKLCDEGFRGRFTFGEDEKSGLITELADCEPILLCTCSRTELYFFGSAEIGAEALGRLAGISAAELKPRLMIFGGRKAVNHLFGVACGIDSMVIGEDEILGQVKKAYAFSAQRIPLSSECNMIFQSAIAAAKKIKTETELSRTSVSTATLAAKAAARLGENVSVMLIGASGEIGGKVLKNLLSYKNVTVYATERSHNRHTAVSAGGVIPVDYDRRYEYAPRCDCIISATTSPHYTITAAELKKHITRGHKLTLIDLAVPNDIDRLTVELENVSVIGIDSFEQLARHNNELKLGSVERAQAIISEEAETLEKQLAFHRILPELNKHYGRLSAENLIYRMKSELSADAFLQVIEVIKGMMK